MLKNLLAAMMAAFLSLHVLWQFDFHYRDTLEVRRLGEDQWTEVPGPYALTPDGTAYDVPVDDSTPGLLFRVRRDFLPPTIKTP